jgi:DNA-binding NarL/FixJ family response regulator
VTIAVVLADDQALVRRGFRLILESEPGIEVVAEAEDGGGAVEAVREHRPDVVLMDIQMPGLDGLEATRRILAGPDNATRVLILTTFERDDYVFQALHAGASGFLLKTAPPEDLVAAVRVVQRGDALLSPSVTRRVIQELGRRPLPAPRSRLLERLTAREFEVLKLVAAGLSNAEIAGELVVSEATVKTHNSNVLAKLGLRDRVHAVIFAYQQGLAGPDDPPLGWTRG